MGPWTQHGPSGPRRPGRSAPDGLHHRPEAAADHGRQGSGAAGRRGRPRPHLHSNSGTRSGAAPDGTGPGGQAIWRQRNAASAAGPGGAAGFRGGTRGDPAVDRQAGERSIGMSFQVAQALAHFLWQGIAIAAVLFVLLHLLRDASARYNACAGALALMCASPVATFFYLTPHAPPAGGVRGMVLDTALPSSGTLATSWFEANATRLFWLWLAGALFLLVRAALAWWRARRAGDARL